MKQQKIRINTMIRDLLNMSRLIRTQLIKPGGEEIHVDQVNDSLVFISPSHQYLYSCEFIRCNDHSRENYNGHVIVWDDYVLKVEETILREDAQRFYEVLFHTTIKPRQHGYRLYFNGTHIDQYYTLQQIQSILYDWKVSRNNKFHPKHDQYKDVKKIKYVSPTGMETIHIHKQQKS